MSVTIDLPNGFSAVLTSQKDMSNRQMRRLRNAGLIAAGASQKLNQLGVDMAKPETWAGLADVDTNDLDSIDEVQRACVAVRLESWTVTQPENPEIPDGPQVPRPLPTTQEEVDELPLWLYTPLVTKAFEDLKWTDFSMEGAGDPKAPTASSDGSRRPGRARSSTTPSTQT